jgi:hypothetical protein
LIVYQTRNQNMPSGGSGRGQGRKPGSTNGAKSALGFDFNQRKSIEGTKRVVRELAPGGPTWPCQHRQRKRRLRSQKIGPFRRPDLNLIKSNQDGVERGQAEVARRVLARNMIIEQCIATLF